jgi:hypothetical protein
MTEVLVALIGTAGTVITAWLTTRQPRDDDRKRPDKQ